MNTPRYLLLTVILASLTLHLMVFAPFLFSWTSLTPLAPNENPGTVEVGFITPAPQTERATLASQEKRPHAPSEPLPATAAHNSSLGTNDSAGLKDSQSNEREIYLRELLKLFNDKKVYPSSARRMRETGRVIVRFLIKADGRIVEPTLAQPSAFESLNRAALNLVQSVGEYKPIPPSILPDGNGLSVQVPVDYILDK